MRTRRRGFSLIELVATLMVVAILARIALPAYEQVVLRARAGALLHDLHTVRVAAFAYFADHEDWPPDTWPGETPPGLVPYLPGGFSFVRDGALLDWENWILPDGTPMHPGTGVLVGVSVTTEDARLGEALVSLVGESALTYTLGDNYTFIIAAM